MVCRTAGGQNPYTLRASSSTQLGLGPSELLRACRPSHQPNDRHGGGAHRHKKPSQPLRAKNGKRLNQQSTPPFAICSASPSQNHSSQSTDMSRIHQCRSPCIHWRKSHFWLRPPGGSCERRRRLAALLNQRRNGQSRSEGRAVLRRHKNLTKPLSLAA